MIESWNEIQSIEEDKYATGPQPSKYFKMLDKKDCIEKPVIIRPIGPILVKKSHAVKLYKISKDRKLQKEDSLFTCPCCNYDPMTGEYVENNCPYCKAGFSQKPRYYQNVIVWQYDEHPPADLGIRTESEKTKKKLGNLVCYLKDSKESSAWTPVRVIEYPSSMRDKFKAIEESMFFIDKDGTRYDNLHINSIKGGTSIAFKYQPSVEPANMYTVSRIDDYGRVITNEQRSKYLLWNLAEFKAASLDTVIRNLELNAYRIVDAKNPEVITEFMNSHPKCRRGQENRTESKKEKAPIKTVSLNDEEEVELPKVSDISKTVAIEEDSVYSSSIEDADFEDLD